MRSRLLAVIAAGFIAGLVPCFAGAQEAIPKEITADMAPAAPSPAAPQGWVTRLAVGGTGSYGHSSNVVGNIDGTTVQLGALVTGSAVLNRHSSSWENELKLTETQTRTPQIDSFIKSADELALQSTYLYRLPRLDWFGPFARASASTQVFRSYDVRTSDVTVLRQSRRGTQDSQAVTSGDRIELAKPFEPLLAKESAGLFANPYAEEALSVKAKLGAGLQHVIVRDGYALADRADTPEIELRQLEKSTQGGAEAGVELAGQLAENVAWGARATVFYPFYSSVTNGLDGVELMSTDLSAKVSVRLAKWVSLDYVVSAKRIPLILDNWQVQNNLLLTVGFTLL